MSWKTTLCGIMALIASIIVQFYPEHAKHGFSGLVCPCGRARPYYSPGTTIKPLSRWEPELNPESRQLPLLVFLFGLSSWQSGFFMLLLCWLRSFPFRASANESGRNKDREQANDQHVLGQSEQHCQIASQHNRQNTRAHCGRVCGGVSKLQRGKRDRGSC
jgi:hypothetical protein